MATIRAIANGNWSSTSTWNGGVLPGNGDTVYASGFNVTIDQNVTIGGANNPSVAQGSLVAGQWYKITTSGTTNWTSIGASSSSVGTIFLKNATAATGSGGVATALATITTAADTNAGAAAAGNFTITTAYTFNCDIRAGTTNCLSVTGAGTLTLDSLNIVAGSVSGATGVNYNGTGTLAITSTNLTGAVSAAGINNASIGTVNVTSSTLTGNNAIYNNSTGTVTVTSSTLTGNNAIYNTATGTVNVTSSNLTGNNAIYNASTGTVNVTSSTVTGGSNTIYNTIYNGSTGTVTVTSSTIIGSTGNAINNASTGTVTVTSSTIIGSTGNAINNASTGTVNVTLSTLSAGTGNAINSTTAGSIVCTGCTFTASTAASAISSTNASATNRFSGTFIHATNGYQPINAIKWILNTAPTNSYFQIPLDGINSNSFVRYYTADNALGQANPTDVRTGVSYASGALTGRLTVPAEGTVANGVTVGPNMPLTTATRSGTTATAFTAFPFPYQASDTIVVTGASNAEWNDTYNLTAAQNNPTQTAGAFNVGSIYAIASVGTTNFTLIGAASNTVGLTFTATGVGSGTGTATLSGSILTFPVPASHSASAGSGATAQTVGQAMLTAANIAAALTAQGFTSARAVNLDNLDSSVSSRLATSGYTAPTAPPTAAANASAVWSAATRTLTSASGPTAAENATAVWSAATRTVTGGTVDTLTNAPASVTPSDIWSHATRTLTSASGPTAVQIRQEIDANSTKLDAAISTRATPANIPSADITAIKAKTDALNTTRLAQAATTEIVGSLLAQANS